MYIILVKIERNISLSNLISMYLKEVQIMKKTNDRKVTAVLTAVAVISGSALAGGITGYHQSDCIRE